MTRRIRVRIVSYLTSAFLVLCVFASMQMQRAQQAERLLIATYQRAMGDLRSEMTQLDYSLTKGQYATSPALLSTLASEIFSKSASATAALSQLPYSNGSLNKTAKFITQVGDYAYALGRDAAQGKMPDEVTAKNLAALSKNADRLSADLNQLYGEMLSGELNFQLVRHAENELQKEEKSDVTGDFETTLEGIEEEFPEYPTLIYDGPFSEHLADRKPVMLDGQKEISREEAQSIAAKFLGVSVEQVTCDNTVSGGNIPAYSVRCGDIGINITKQGGAVQFLISEREVGAAAISDAEAIKKARAFLEEHGYKNMRESYYTRYANTIMINFAATQGDTLLYPDLIKITIALDNGSVMNLETTGYLMNHKVRALPKDARTKDEILAKVPKTLSVQSIGKALIPTEGEHEVLTYEVACKAQNGRHIMLYYDVKSGEEVRILVLIEDENGTLAM